MEVRNSESPPPSVQTSEAMPVCVCIVVCVCCVVGYHYDNNNDKLTYNAVTVRKQLILGASHFVLYREHLF